MLLSYLSSGQPRDMSTIFLLFLLLTLSRGALGQSSGCADTNGRPIACMTGPQNVVRGRTINVSPTNSTCGNPASGYCRPKPRNGCFRCDSSNPSQQHGPEKMQDTDYPSGLWDVSTSAKPTWWQSITWWDARQRGMLIDNTVKVNLTVSMNKSFDITGNIKLTFYSSRPKAIIIEKSVDFGRTWIPYSYYADNCNTRFTTPIPKRTSATTINRFQAYCEENTNPSAEQGAAISFNPMMLFSSSEFWQSNVQEYVKATDIRVRLEYPWTDGNQVIAQEVFLNQYYYDVTDLQIHGRCHCNGHGQYCIGSLDQLQCQCDHFTEGVDCERCLPLYNNKTWMAASGQYQPNPCERCECNNHAQRCVFNSTLGFGVCSDCNHNTTGLFCDKCQDKFYRNMSQSINHPNVCLSCDCFPFGITNNGSCSQAITGNLTIGQCSCKTNFRGRRCDQCTDGFYGVTIAPIGECKACNCSNIGSVNSSITCHQLTGQCQCKQSINGKTCSTCKDGYHSFPNTTSGECEACVCDAGGAYSNTCNKTSGHCFCRKGIEGTSCTTAMNGYFVASFDYLLNEAETSAGNFISVSNTVGYGSRFTGHGFARIVDNGSLTLFLSPTFTTSYLLVIRYRHNQNQPLQLSAVMHFNNNSVSLVFSSFGVTLPSSNSSQSLAYSHPDSFTLLANGNYSLTLTFANSSNGNQSLDVDSVLLMWDINQTRYYQTANQTMKEAARRCWQSKKQVNMAPGSIECQKVEFSVNAESFNGSIACDCNRVGTLNNTNCAKIGGQCQCKPGVMGRKCDQCRPGFYNFTADGCTACNCTVLGSTNLVCDVVTGQCPCKPGVVNRTCSACRPSFFGYQTGLGCRNCSCNWDGSAYMFCNEDGSCICKNSTTGLKCDRCKPLFYNFTSAGCSPCNCDSSGSTNLQCDLMLGNCSCKANTQGTKCDRCAPSTFNLQSSNIYGCQNCFCYNMTDQCSSAKGTYRRDIQSQFLNNSDYWTVFTEPGSVVVSSNTSSGLSVNLTDAVPVFFQAPTKFLGNKLSSYGQTFTMQIAMTPITGLVIPSIRITLIIAHTDNRSVTFNLPTNSTLRQQTLTVRLQENFAVTRMSTWTFQYILTSIRYMTIQLNATGLSNVVIKSVQLSSTWNQSVLSQLSTYAENCSCPSNFTGGSCEVCAPGYTREIPNGGSYTNCRLCACNSRSASCHPQNGICSNCRIGTEGNYCERCQSGVQEPNCTQCIPGYYGLNDTSSPGCRACNCVLLNTIGRNSSVCNALTGQCDCRPNIGGIRCERCAENAVNITGLGCQTCPECYRLIQVEVHNLRKDIQNISNKMAAVESISQLRLSPSFGARLTSLTNSVSQLTASARNSSTVESGLAAELLALNYSLDTMQRTLEVNVSRALNDSDANMRVANATRQQINLLRTAIYSLLWGANYVLQTDVAESVNRTQNLANNISTLATNVTSVWEQNRGQYSRTSSLNAQILSLSANVTNTTDEMIMQRNQTVHTLNTTQALLQQHRNSLQRIQVSLNLLQTSLNVVMSNASTLSARSSQALVRAQSLNSTTYQNLTQIRSEHARLQASVDALNSTLIRLNNDYNILRQNLTTINATATTLQTSLVDLESEMASLASQARNAETTAAAAVISARNVLKEAEDMLNIMQNFNSTSRAAESMADFSLRHTNEVNATSMQALRYTESMKADLDSAVGIAALAQSVAQNASNLASNVSQILSALLNESRILRSKASSSPYADNYFSNIQTNVSATASGIVQLRSNQCRNYTARANLSVENATASLAVAKNLSNEVTAKKNEIDNLVKDFQNLSLLNATALQQLQQKLRQNRQSFDASNIKTMLIQLRAAFSSQQETLRSYRTTITRLRADVTDTKRLVDEISTLQGCG